MKPTRIQLAPGWLLTNDHVLSRDGMVVLLHEPTGQAYAPSDYIGLGGTNQQLATEFVARLANRLPADQQAQVRQFCG
jgi:hypothetical protein